MKFEKETSLAWPRTVNSVETVWDKKNIKITQERNMLSFQLTCRVLKRVQTPLLLVRMVVLATLTAAS